ncbi:MAG: helix-turn-helix domain-containing protein [Phycisphaeraceae bacterium]
MNDSSPTRAPQKKYPIRCIECGKVEVRPAIVSHTMKRNHEGRVYELKVDRLPASKCTACGAVSFNNDSHEATAAALRSELGLLFPNEIREHIESLGLTQRDAAEQLGVAPETMSRWVNGTMIQSRAMDNWMRAFFAAAPAADAAGLDRLRRRLAALPSAQQTSLLNEIERIVDLFVAVAAKKA